MPSESRQAHLVGTLPQSAARSLRNGGVGRWRGGRAVRSTSSPPARKSRSSSRAIPAPRPSHQQELSLHQGCSAADIPPVRGAGETEPPERRRRSQPPNTRPCSSSPSRSRSSSVSPAQNSAGPGGHSAAKAGQEDVHHQASRQRPALWEVNSTVPDIMFDHCPEAIRKLIKMNRSLKYSEFISH